MTHDDIKRSIEIIAGGCHRGFLTAAATALKVSDRTIHRAYSGGLFSSTLGSRIMDAAATANARAEKALSSHAGSWSIGHVENRPGGTDVVDESVVIHLRSPSFVLHVEMLRGKAADGGSQWDEHVRWYDEPKHEEQRQMLMKIAREKGKASIYERSQASADIRMREHHLAKAKRVSPLEESELMQMGTLALSAEGEGVDADDIKEAMNAEIERLHGVLGGNLDRASMDLGQLVMAYRMACIVSYDTDQTWLPAYIAAKAHKLLPVAHLNTIRGKRKNVGGGVHDAV